MWSFYMKGDHAWFEILIKEKKKNKKRDMSRNIRNVGLDYSKLENTVKRFVQDMSIHLPLKQKSDNWFAYLLTDFNLA